MEDSAKIRKGRLPLTEAQKSAKQSLFKKNTTQIKKEVVEEQTIQQKPIIQKEMKTNEEFEMPENYSPLDAEVVERSYNEATVITEIGDIPEPDFGNGMPDFEDAIEETIIEKKEPSAFDNISNPAMSEMDKKDKAIASEYGVDALLDGYEMLVGAGSHLFRIKEQKILKRIDSGEINKDLKLLIAEDTEVTALEFVSIHNDSVDEVFQYDKSFNDKVREPLQRIFAKKGWGISDEQLVGIAFAQDLLMRGVSAIAIRKNSKDMLDYFAEHSKQSQFTEQPIPQVFTPDSIQQQAKNEATVEMKVETAIKISQEDIEAELMND